MSFTSSIIIIISVIIIYYVLSISLILYSLVRKNQISRKILRLLFFPESLAVIVFFFGKKCGCHLSVGIYHAYYAENGGDKLTFRQDYGRRLWRCRYSLTEKEGEHTVS